LNQKEIDRIRELEKEMDVDPFNHELHAKWEELIVYMYPFLLAENERLNSALGRAREVLEHIKEHRFVKTPSTLTLHNCLFTAEKALKEIWGDTN